MGFQTCIHPQKLTLDQGKHGFITLRDLFRWADRGPTSVDELAAEGYMLLAERLRNPEEKEIVKSTLEKHLNVRIAIESLYSEQDPDLLRAKELLKNTPYENVRSPDALPGIVHKWKCTVP